MNNDHDSSTRRMIITLLKTRGPVTVSDLAKELGITEMAVRRHLNTMERDGWIETRLLRQAMGRPAKVYSLTSGADDLFPANYHSLALDLLGELEAEEGTDRIHELFEGRKRKLADKYKSQVTGETLPERVAELAAIQNAQGYMVQWKIEGEELLLEEFNCPIAQVAAKYKKACACELELFRGLLEADVERTECLTEGGRKCAYVIRKSEPKSLD